MWKPSLNHVSVIKCGQISKSWRNASIIGVSSLVNHSDLCLGHFGDVISATGPFGEGGRRCFIRKKFCFENTSMVVTTKDVCWINVFVILRASVVSLPPVGWKSLVRP